MTDYLNAQLGRRGFMAATGGVGLLVLSGCTGVKTAVYSAVIRRMMVRSADKAIANMTAPGGFWEQTLASSDIGSFMGPYQPALKAYLMTPTVEKSVQQGLEKVARGAAKEVAPVMGRFVAEVGIKNAQAIAEGGPTAAAEYLRQNSNGALAKAMNSQIVQALAQSDQPILPLLREQLATIDTTQITNAISQRLEDVMWDEVGKAEAEIRANPELTRDAELIDLLGRVKR